MVTTQFNSLADTSYSKLTKTITSVKRDLQKLERDRKRAEKFGFVQKLPRYLIPGRTVVRISLGWNKPVLRCRVLDVKRCQEFGYVEYRITLRRMNSSQKFTRYFRPDAYIWCEGTN